jgi:nucleotide-binding universal stress UspA family protein
MKVLVGYDGSDSARDAIHGLTRAGLPRGTEFLVVSVADVWPQLPQSAYEPAGAAPGFKQSPIVKRAHALADAARSEARALAEEGAALLATVFPGSPVAHASYAGSPYLALIEPTGGVPDLVVVGSGGRSVQRILLGSVSQNVQSHAPCSVRISRAGDGAKSGAKTPVRIVLGVDGSVHSASAVSAVASRAWPAGSQVKVIAAVDLKLLSLLAAPGSAAWAPQWKSVTAAEGDADPADAQSPAQQAVEAVAEELRLAGLLPVPVVTEGDPKRVLVEEAERWAADCIFVGAKGHSRLERFLLGSVSASVAARAPCSVEVVRQG